jgi:hypothetical protein
MKRNAEFYEQKRSRALRMIVAAAHGETLEDIARREEISTARVQQLIQWGAWSVSKTAHRDGLISETNAGHWTLAEIRALPGFWEELLARYGKQS